MFDKRLFKELKIIKGYWIKMTVAACATVILTIVHHWLLAVLVDGLIFEKIKTMNWKALMIFIFLMIVIRGGLRFKKESYQYACARRIKSEKRKALLLRIYEKGPVEMKDEQEGAISNLLQKATKDMETFYSEFVPQVITVAASSVLVLISVFFLDILSGVIMVVILPFIPVFMILIGKMTGRVSLKQWKLLQLQSGHFLDVLRGMTTLKFFNRLEDQVEVVKKVNESFRKTTMKVLKIAFLSALTLELVATLSTAVIAVALGVRLVYGNISFLNAFFILLMAPEFFQPLRILGMKFHAVVNADTGAKSIYDFLEGHEQEEENSQQATEVKPISWDKPSLLLKDVSFAYDKEHAIIQDLSLRIDLGEKIALIGPSGEGKTTLISLILGFVKDYKGYIGMETFGEFYTRQEISDKRWKSFFSYIPQKPKLFRGSLRDNITIANPEADDDMVMSVLEKVGLSLGSDDFCMGLDTQIGEGGLSPSGGQTQLIALARALINNTPFLIMDEPTSALDPDSESKIGLLLEEGFQGKAIIVIAHRIPTILRMDRVIFLSQAKITEYGKELDYGDLEALFSTVSP